MYLDDDPDTFPKRPPETFRPYQGQELEEVIRITVVVRCRATDQEREASIAKTTAPNLNDRQYLSHEEFEKRFGADPAALETVSAFARSQGLVVVEVSVAGRSVVLEGTLAAFSHVFGIELGLRQRGSRSYRSYQGEVNIPDQLAGIVKGIFGFDNRAVAQDHLCFVNSCGAPIANPLVFARNRYNFPNLDGQGECIGIIRLAGGYHDTLAVPDVNGYFGAIGLPRPNITPVPLGGDPDENGGNGTNSPAAAADILRFFTNLDRAIRVGVEGSPYTGDPRLDRQVLGTIETTLDIQLVGSLANRAQIVVYFAPNSEAGILSAFRAALTDTQNNPSVILCCWGWPDTAEGNLYKMTGLEPLLADAGLLRKTICFSSGDRDEVHQPATSASVLACGGTMFDSRGVEKAWSEAVFRRIRIESGGGFSEFVPQPTWQAFLGIVNNNGIETNRGVPDVAAKADLNQAYSIRVGGSDYPAGGGTSAAAPLWASLIALCNQERRRLGRNLVGHLTPTLYQVLFNPNPTLLSLLGGVQPLKDITQGTRAGRGWDTSTGLGSPNGQALVTALRNLP